MGLEILVERAAPPPLAAVVAKLPDAMIVMIDGALQPPGAAPSVTEWRDVRLRTAAGTVTLVRRPGGIAVIVFGNADAALVAAQRAVAAAVEAA